MSADSPFEQARASSDSSPRSILTTDPAHLYLNNTSLTMATPTAQSRVGFTDRRLLAYERAGKTLSEIRALVLPMFEDTPDRIVINGEVLPRDEFHGNTKARIEQLLQASKVELNEVTEARWQVERKKEGEELTHAEAEVDETTQTISYMDTAVEDAAQRIADIEAELEAAAKNHRDLKAAVEEEKLVPYYKKKTMATVKKEITAEIKDAIARRKRIGNEHKFILNKALEEHPKSDFTRYGQKKRGRSAVTTHTDDDEDIQDQPAKRMKVKLDEQSHPVLKEEEESTGSLTITPAFFRQNQPVESDTLSNSPTPASHQLRATKSSPTEVEQEADEESTGPLATIPASFPQTQRLVPPDTRWNAPLPGLFQYSPRKSSAPKVKLEEENSSTRPITASSSVEIRAMGLDKLTGVPVEPSETEYCVISSSESVEEKAEEGEEDEEGEEGEEVEATTEEIEESEDDKISLSDDIAAAQ